MENIYTNLDLMIQDMIDWNCYIFRADNPKNFLVGFTSYCNSWHIKLMNIKNSDLYELRSDINNILSIVNKNKEIPECNEIGINMKCNNCIIKNIIE